MNQAFHLYRLQQIDTQIDQAESQLAEIQRLLAGDETVRQARQALENAAHDLRTVHQNLKQAEFMAKEQQIKIAQAESTLYSGRVRNPKELQDLQKDIASLKKHLATLEDHQLEIMLALEEAESRSQNAQQDLDRVTAAFMEKSAGWLGKKDLLSRNLDRLKAERAAATPPIAPETLQAYETMRKRKNGVAVTSFSDGSCAVCGAAIRPSEVQAARSASSLVFCSSCGRILYAV